MAKGWAGIKKFYFACLGNNKAARNNSPPPEINPAGASFVSSR
jgi:hypothetical protein